MPVELVNGILQFRPIDIGKTPVEVLQYCVDDIEAGYWVCGSWSCATILNGFKHPKGCAMALIAMHSSADLGIYHITAITQDEDGYDYDYEEDPKRVWDKMPDKVQVCWDEPFDVKHIVEDEVAAETTRFVFGAIPESFKADEIGDEWHTYDMSEAQMLDVIVRYNDNGIRDANHALEWFQAALADAKAAVAA